jgi:hypothetical protein
MKSFQTVCIDIEASPLLGGTLITIAEGVIEFGYISLCMYSNSTAEIDIKKVDPILLMALDIEGVVGSSYTIRDNVKVSYGSWSKHFHINSGRVINSPARLVEIAPSYQICQVLKFKPEIYLSAIKKLRVKKTDDYLVLHANLVKKLQFFSHGSKKLSLGIERSWAKAIEMFVSNKICVSVMLIGSDSKYFRKFDLGGIHNTYDNGLNLSEQLSLVAKSKGFVGMSAGPSVIALLGTTPYYIFKDSNHHQAQMNRELGQESKYTFSAPNQFYVRKYPSSKILYDSMISIVSGGKTWHI